VLLAAGLLLVLYGAADFLLADWRQGQDEARWRQLVPSVPAQAGVPGALARPVEGMDFRLLVPKLGYAAVVREGIGLDVLASGPGHYPGSSWPGQDGNVGIAAHNAFWIQFDLLRPGDELAVETRYGTFRYRVVGSRVVSPDDRAVLAAQPGRRLTLTTCWPLWAGQLATRRLAIFAGPA
jgi:sortase A